MAKKDTTEEVLKNNQRTKEVYHYIDHEEGIEIKSKEVFKNGKKIVHYPFRRDGSPKYNNIKAIIYEEMPDSLPRGFIKAYQKGYGLTKTCQPLIYQIQDKYPSVDTLVFSTKQNSRFDTTKVIFNANDFDRQYNHLALLFQRHSTETKTTAHDVLANIFPGQFKGTKKTYTKGSLSLFIKTITDNISEFSIKDTEAVVEIFNLVAENKEIEQTVKTLRTKEIIEEYYLEEILKQFKKNLDQKNDTQALEKKWQAFFKEYNWIFSQLFASPVIYFDSEAYVGGKTIGNTNGKVVDFVYKNALTNNVTLIEIKTHLTPLLESKAYRGKDVFSITKHFSGAISQVLDQKDNLLSEFNSLSKGTDLQAFNPRCIVVIGKIDSLSKDQRKSFELFRNSYKEINIVTFDEIFKTIENLLKILTRKKGPNK